MPLIIRLFLARTSRTSTISIAFKIMTALSQNIWSCWHLTNWTYSAKMCESPLFSPKQHWSSMLRWIYPGPSSMSPPPQSLSHHAYLQLVPHPHLERQNRLTTSPTIHPSFIFSCFNLPSLQKDSVSHAIFMLLNPGGEWYSFFTTITNKSFNTFHSLQ